MKQKERSQKEITGLIEKTIKTGLNVLNASAIMTGYDFFNQEEFKKTGFNKIIFDLCEKEKISFEHVIKVAGWN
jgi:hypothetical protein